MTDTMDPWALLGQMLRCRRLEEIVRDLWIDGLVSGEMHLGIGEEGIVAGVGAHLVDGDALALDHRGTAAMLVQGLPAERLIAEMLGSRSGLSEGSGGHMHLLSKAHLAASSGIVGAAAPTGTGFALAAQMLRPGHVAVAYFGDGAMNQGMVLESLNLAAAWKLPVLFVCKDSGWAITTPKDLVTPGELHERARSFGMPSHLVQGWNAEEVWEAARRAIARARRGDGPSFIQAECVHFEGHFLGDPLLRLERHPAAEGRTMAGPLMRAATALHGGSLRERAAGVASITTLLLRHAAEHGVKDRDPVALSLARLREVDTARTHELTATVDAEMSRARTRALEGTTP